MTPDNEAWMAEVRLMAETDPILGPLFQESDHGHWPYSHTSCRNISGTNRPSIHSWGAAGDVMRLSKGISLGVAPASAPVLGLGPGDPGWYHLDEIYWWLQQEKERLNLRNVIYRRLRSNGTYDHRDHIHIDGQHRPEPDSKPPCMGGTLKTINPSGGWVLTVGSFPPSPDPGDDELVKVEDLQRTLKDAGYDPGKVDGVYGPKTAGAWLAMMTDAQSTAEPPTDVVQFGDAVILGQP